jgi:hypothetical protein
MGILISLSDSKKVQTQCFCIQCFCIQDIINTGKIISSS